MKYAKILNDEIVEIGVLTSLFPNTSFPDTGVTDEWLNLNQLLKVVDILPFTVETQRLVYGSPYIKDGKVYTCEVVEMTYDEQELYRSNNINSQWTNIRTDRNVRLKESDWAILSDSPVDKEVWATYRQQLRDITNQVDPFNINWPTKP